jgi:spore coat polysaccharide biosynthesis protein SpsF
MLHTKKIGAIVQARMGSTRLRGKVLLPLGNGTVLTSVIERLKKTEGIQVIVIATTLLKEDRIILEEAKKSGVEVFCGEEEDVLRRFTGACRKFGIDYLVRVTSDCPLFYYEGISELIKLHIKEEADYSFNYHRSIKSYDTGMPLGLGSEVVSTGALLRADNETENKEDREHVTLYLEANPGIFKIKKLNAPPELYGPEMRLTIDTREDYTLIKKLYEALYQGGPIPTARAIKFLKENPGLLAINKNIPARALCRRIAEL